MNENYISEFEKLVNNAVAGNLPKIDREAFKASYMNGNLQGEKPEEKRIGYLQMVGPMFTYGSYWFYGADDYVRALRYMNENDSVSAIVMDIDGPGGIVDGIELFKEFALEIKKPIVIICNMLCSFHYWLACLFKAHIMAKGSVASVIGSIGAAQMFVDSREAMAKDGYKFIIINAPGSELKNKTMQDFYDGKDEDFINRIKAELKPIRDAFVADVQEAMPDISDDPRVMSADTFNANEALELGMIHSIGNTKKAFALAQALAELNQN